MINFLKNLFKRKTVAEKIKENKKKQHIKIVKKFYYKCFKLIENNIDLGYNITYLTYEGYEGKKLGCYLACRKYRQKGGKFIHNRRNKEFKLTFE